MADSDGVELSTQRRSVPNGCVLRNLHVSDKSGVGCNPCVFHLRDLVVEWKHFPVSAHVSFVCDIVVESRSEPVHGYLKLKCVLTYLSPFL